MKRLCFLALPLALISLPGCTSSSQAGKGAAAPVPAEAPVPTAEQEERARQAVESARRMAGAPPVDLEANPEEPWIIVTDEATGKKLQRVPKSKTLKVVDGKLRHTLLNPAMFTMDFVREDEKYYYVVAPDDAATARRKAAEVVPDGLAPIIEFPESEYEVVTPKTSRTRLRFEEKSAGLPTSGFWRSTMKVADLDGDGSPEIVTGPPRLAGGTFRVFRFDGAAWQPVTVQVDPAEEGVRFGYGGVAVADMDADGKPDVLGIGHGSGPVVAYNLGGWKFRLEARGMPRQMTGRSLGAGDVDGDGRLDVVAVSDDPESLRRAEAQEKATMYTAPGSNPTGRTEGEGYREGWDMRAFFQKPDGRFEESTAGFEMACFGYSMSLAAPPLAGGPPFFVSGCRYQGGRALLYEWDAPAKAFRSVGRGVVENYSFHSGTAVGTYRGFPAAFASYVKGNAPGAVARPIRGHGVSIYYRDRDGWKARRLVKVLAEAGDESQGLGVGDLNGDGLDDVVWADDSLGRVRVFFQTAGGDFEELDAALQPRFVNHSMDVKVVDVDRDGKNDVVLMYEFRTTDKSRAGGLRFFRNLG
ncbi:MAG: VCBS repeat-containing protein [Holophagales bacterium]|nr:VCBS repeat-containing protein [Holophagales bacterium]